MNRQKKILYICIAGLFVLMLTMVVTSFVLGEPKYQIGETTIYIFLIIAVILIFDSVESLSIGNVVSLTKKVKQKEQEIVKLGEENQQLRNQILTVVKTNFNSQTSTNLIFGGNPNDYIVEKAEEKELQEEKESKIETPPVENLQGINSGVTNRRIMFKFREAVDELLLKRFLKENDISEIKIQRDMKIKSLSDGADPIMERDIIYFAYLKRHIDEIFIEVLSTPTPHLITDFKLYFMISRIYHYCRANQVKAQMILLVPQYPKSYFENKPEIGRRYDIEKFLNRLNDIYSPAIKNGLLKIISIDISDEDIKELDQQSQSH